MKTLAAFLEPWTKHPNSCVVLFLMRAYRADRWDITVDQAMEYAQAVALMGADYRSVENRFAEDFNLPPESK